MATKQIIDPPQQFAGWLLKKSPGKWRQIVPGMTMQKRWVIIDNARLYYSVAQGPLESNTGGEKGVIDLLSNDCEVNGEGTSFSIKPKSGTWSTGSFTGVEIGRAFEFDSAGSEHPMEMWVANLRAHMDFAVSVKLSLLAKVPLVKRLPPDQHIKMASCCVAMEYAKGDVIVRENDMGEEFFVLLSGDASVTIHGHDEPVAHLKAGDYFGETALRQTEPRAATVTALSSISAFQIKRQRFEEAGLHRMVQFPNRRAVGAAPGPAMRKKIEPTPKSEDDARLIASALHNNPFLRTLVDLNEFNIKQLVELAQKEQVPAGKILINEGDLDAESFYIVAQGEFQVSITGNHRDTHNRKSLVRGYVTEGQTGVGEPLPKIGPGGSFGELALLYLEPRAATITAVTPASVWVIDRHPFKDILMKVSDSKINEYIEHLKEVSNLSCLLDEERRMLAKSLVEVLFYKDDIILEQGEYGSTFYILYEGSVKIKKNGKDVKTLSASVEEGVAQYFGEAALLDHEVRAATVQVVSEEAKALAMDRETFDNVLGPLKDIIDRTRKEGTGRKLWPVKAKVMALVALQGERSLKKGDIKQEDLKKVGLLGCGGFGVVELVEHLQTGETYALKALSKGFVVKANMQKNVMNEKEIQITLNSPFIVKLWETYNSDQKLYFLLEPALGGELYATYMRKGLHGNVKHAQFYVAGVVYAFEHLHGRSIIYRDLKPENLLLTETGHVKLTDMGLAKVVSGKTYTSCGTPDYFAPEIIKSAGHGKPVDWWEVGILIFELMTGHPPFESRDPMETYQKICNGIERVNFPLNCKGVVGDLVKQLCKKQPSERLPMRAGGTKNIKTHPWFITTKFDWDAMRLLTLPPPYVPVVKSKKDLANFPDSMPNMPRQIDYKDDGSGWDANFATV